MKKLLSLLLLIVVSLSSVVSNAGCKASELKLWTINSAEATTQIIEDIDESSTELKISMAKGEKEGAQIMITASKNVKVKSVNVSALKNGKAVIPSENIDVFYEIYNTVSVHGDTRNPRFKEGDKVSDAIMPFDTAIDYGMTKVKAGNTQGIYLEVETPSNCTAGTYNATVNVETTKGVYSVPMTVNVWDFDITQSTMQNYWMSTARRGQAGSAELDTTDEFATEYFEALLEYRMNDELPFDGTGGVERYISILKKYYNHPHFTTYKLFYKAAFSGVDVGLLTEYIYEIAKVSVADRTDYLSKAMIYLSNLVDEPKTEEQFQRLTNYVNQVASAKNSAILKLAEEYTGTEDVYFFNDVVKNTILALPFIMPICVEASIGQVEDRVELTHCLILPCLEKDTQIDAVREYISKHEYENKLWWYSCNIPSYPYPSSHIDDDNLDFRIMSWMQKKYGYDGYLNWCAVQNSTQFGTNPYETDNSRRDEQLDYYGQCSGDGFVFYPGEPYGIDGPVGSLRAVTYRDGVEDYEMLTYLEGIYKEKGLDADKALLPMYDSLFNEIISTATEEEFINVRNTVGNMISATSGDLGILYKETIVSKNQAELQFVLTNENATVSYKGQNIAPGVDGVYSVSINLTEEQYVQLTVSYDGTSIVYSKFIAGRYGVISNFDSQADMQLFTKNSDSSISLNSEAQFVDAGLNSSIKVSLTGKLAASSSFYPYCAINLSNFTFTDCESIALRIYCDNEDGLDINISSFNGLSYRVIRRMHLEYGWNDISISMMNVDISYDNKLYFRTNNLVNEEGTEAYSIDLYFNNLTCLFKEGK